ncbi:MAG: RNA methyltransferase [Oscillospiraceae bacterium]|nr:RNA methyltransferase [Oscillospiraceae bacterium]
MANIIEITDFNDPRLDIYARLTENQLLNREHPEDGVFIAESPKVVERALDAGFEAVSILTERRHIEGQSAHILRRCGDVPIFTAELDVLTKLTGFKLTRGLLCAMRRKSLPGLTQVCEGTRRVAVLENVVNPTNIGAIFRSAAALNMDAVLLTPACCDPLYRRSSRVSMGTVFQIPWTYLGEDWHAQLKSMGFKTVSMALKEDSLNIDDPRLAAEKRLAVILGTEGDGLADSTIEESDFTVCIPMSHGVDSLNVAAASAVAFWQLGKE